MAVNKTDGGLMTTWLYSGPALQACDRALCLESPGIIVSVSSDVIILKFLMIFEQRGLHCHFVLGPSNHLVGPTGTGR